MAPAQSRRGAMVFLSSKQKTEYKKYILLKNLSIDTLNNWFSNYRFF